MQNSKEYSLLSIVVSLAKEAVSNRGLGSVVKKTLANSGDVGLILGLGRSPGGGHGNLLQYACLENPLGRGAW